MPHDSQRRPGRLEKELSVGHGPGEQERRCPAHLEQAWGKRAPNTPSLLLSLVPRKGRFILMREVLTKRMSEKARDKSERQRDLIEGKGAERKSPARPIKRRPGRLPKGGGQGGLALAAVAWAWKHTRKGLTRGGMCEKDHGEASLAQHGLGETQGSAWSPKSFPVPLQPTPLGSGEMDGGQEVRFPDAPRPRWPDSCSAQLLGTWGGGGPGAAADLI